MNVKLLKDYFFPLILLLSFFVFLAHTAYTNTAIFADGKFYFAYTRSIVFDLDLNLANEYINLGINPAINFRGFVINTYPPGVSLSWIPLYWIFGGIVHLLNFIPALTIDGSGYGLIHQIAVATTSMFLGIFGLYLIHVLHKKYFSKNTALLTSFALFFATNLFFYIAVEPINSHSVSFFVSTLLVFFLLAKVKNFSFRNIFIAGLLSGLAGVVRVQDALIIILPIYLLLSSKSKNLFKKLLVLGIGFLIGFLAQIILWKLFFNFYFPPPGWGYGFTFFNPHVIYVLFNTQNGLLSLTPIIFFSFIGLFVFWKKNKKIATIAIIYFLLQLYLISSWRDYTQGGSFSIRMMITTYPLLSFGLAAIIEKSRKKISSSYTILIVLLLSFINMLLMVRYLLLY